MSTQMLSQSCANVIQAIEERTNIKLRRKQDLMLCQLLERAPSDVPADPVIVLRELASSFQADLNACTARLQDDDLFGERTARPASADTITRRRVADPGARLRTGGGRARCPLDPIAHRSRGAGRCKGGADGHLEPHGEAQSTYVYQHAYVIGDLGRWAKPPDKDLDQLRLFQRNLSPGGTGMTENNRRAERVLRLLAGKAFEVRPPAVAPNQALRRPSEGG